MSPESEGYVNIQYMFSSPCLYPVHFSKTYLCIYCKLNNLNFSFTVYVWTLLCNSTAPPPLKVAFSSFQAIFNKFTESKWCGSVHVMYNNTVGIINLKLNPETHNRKRTWTLSVKSLENTPERFQSSVGWGGVDTNPAKYQIVRTVLRCSVKSVQNE